MAECQDEFSGENRPLTENKGLIESNFYTASAAAAAGASNCDGSGVMSETEQSVTTATRATSEQHYTGL